MFIEKTTNDTLTSIPSYELLCDYVELDTLYADDKRKDGSLIWGYASFW